MKAKPTFGWIMTAVLLVSIATSIALVNPVKAQGTITLSSENLHPWKVVEIKITIPGLEASNITLRVTDEGGTPLTLKYRDGSTSSTGTFYAYRVGIGTYYAYLGGNETDLDMNPQYPVVDKDEAIANVTDALASDSVIRLEVLGYDLTKTIVYGTVAPSVTLDRTNVPSRRNDSYIVTLTATDQDLNLDPTARDDLSTYHICADVLHISGTTGAQTSGFYENNSAVETAVNSGTFKVAFTVEDIAPSGVTVKKDDIFLLSVYSNIGWGGDNSPFKKASCRLNVVYTYPTVSISATSQGIKISITSPDDNVNPAALDTLEPGKKVIVSLLGVSPVEIDGSGFMESPLQAGVFSKTLTVSWGDSYALTTTSVTLKRDVKSFTLSATYLDMSGSATYTTVSPTINVTKQSPMSVALTVADADLNMNPYSIDTLTTDVRATNDVIYLNKTGLALYELVIKKPDGTTLDIPGGYTSDKVNFFETDLNTGKFKLTMASQGLFEAGKSYVIVVKDHTGGYTVEVPITITPVQITLDRPTYPINRDYNVVVYVTYSDDAKNTNPELKDSVSAGTLKYNITNPVTGEVIETAQTVGPLTETAPDSGIFVGAISITANLPKYIDAKITVYLAADPTVKYEAVFKAYQLSATDLKVEPAQISVTGNFTITVNDPDANVNSMIADSAIVNVIVGGTTTPKTLRETGPNTGIFRSTFKASDFGATPASTITIKYTEKTPALRPTETSFSGTEYDLTATVKVISHSGVMTVPRNWIGPYEIMNINVTDPDLNMQPDIAETKTALVKVTVEGTTITRSIDMDETGTNTGVFSGKLNLPLILTGQQAPLPKDLAPYIGKTITLVYIDEANADGNRATVTKTLKITAVDAEITTDKAAVKIDESFKITISNPDIAENPTPEFRTINVKSTTYPTGVSLYASETTPGVYEVSVTVVSLNNWVVGAPQIPATLGDTITILYEDPIGAAGESKVITKTINVGVPVERPVPASGQKFVDPNTGAEKTSGKVGEAIMLQATVTNVDAVSKPFTAIFKVKDSAGVTIFISWVTGTLAPGQSLSPAVSWTPAEPGTYTVEVLVVKSIADPTPYSDKISAQITVAA